MHQTRKILIAEDDPHLCRYLVALLDQRNCGRAPWGRCDSTGGFVSARCCARWICHAGDGSTTGVGLLKVSPYTNVVFITEFVLPEILENLKAHGYHFKTLLLPSNLLNWKPCASLWRTAPELRRSGPTIAASSSPRL